MLKHVRICPTVLRQINHVRMRVNLINPTGQVRFPLIFKQSHTYCCPKDLNFRYRNIVFENCKIRHKS